MTIPSGGFLRSGEAAKVDTATRAVLGSWDDGTVWQTKVGTWSANGTQLTTSTARASDPRIIAFEEYSDFDFKADVAWGDAIYFRYQDESNWLRIVHWQDYSQTSYACNPYACNPYACNPYSCNPYACNPYACNPYMCNCVQGYMSHPSYVYTINCSNSNGTSNPSYSSSGCDLCDYSATPCGGVYHYVSTNGCASSGVCYTPIQTCDTCYQTCYSTCYSTCYDTCYQTCYQTCYTDHNPSYIRLEKFVAGVLTNLAQVQLNGDVSVDLGYIRATGKGSAINVYTNTSPSTALITQTVIDNQFAKGYGVGRHGYGNQDSAPQLDNITLKPF